MLMQTKKKIEKLEKNFFFKNQTKERAYGKGKATDEI